MTYCNLSIREKCHVLWFDTQLQAKTWLKKQGLLWNGNAMVFENAKGDYAQTFTPYNNDKPTAFSEVEKEIAA